ncbi:MOSC domain containing protein [Crinalium epipsammum PCC 9333]|uniref:MOSC domain containing protein n=1 Tax=Crinalium epipsammum PCC 9333 TaxID=1173022 RepID=K9W5Z5_9CYAN|nr:MOSC domain-containing protein [Crinalium epipsammum]AFZ14895.1 MOSC domain containing protein [Crinalium epipsammum PCC 9333]
MSKITIKQLFTYYIKGLTPHACESVFLKEGHGIPGDRTFALMYDDNLTDIGEAVVPWMKKKHFAVQNDWAGLAGLSCHYDVETALLTVKRHGVKLLVSATNTEVGRDNISKFFTGYLAGLTSSELARHPDHAPLRFVGDSNGSARYPDREPVHISLLSQGTLNALSDLLEQQVDVRRFRPNVVLEGVEPWEEFKWVGQEFMLGTAKIKITAPINRCLNINVHPEKGELDLPLLTKLKQHYGHVQTGVLATVLSSGFAKIGDKLINI